MRRSTSSRTRVRALLSLTVAGTLVPALALSAAAGTRDPNVAKYRAAHASSSAAARVASPACRPLGPDSGSDAVVDVDGDDRNDFVVGEPLYRANTDNQGQGAIETLMSTAGTQRLLDGTFGGDDASSDDAFGSAVALSDLDHDLCSEIVVGSPGDAFVSGHVIVLHGSPVGVTATPFEVMQAPTPAHGDGYGTAVAISRQEGDGLSKIWVGAPGTTVGGHLDAGAVYEYLVSTSGTVTLNQTITEASAAIGLTPAAGDRFGSVISPIGDGSVTIGVPDRDVSTHADAGMIVHLDGSYASGPATAAEIFTQSTPGVPGVAEAGDHFGAAVTDGTVVGVPMEDIGAAKNAGAIQLFGFTTSTPARLTPKGAYDENSAGVPGAAESGDHFGAALATGFGVACHEVSALMVGVPGESVGSIKHAGGVVLMPAKEQALSCPGAFLRQGSGLPGRPETDDAVGSALATLPDIEGLDEDTSDSILIGVPGEDVGSVKNAGIVQWFYGSGVADLTSVHGPIKGLQFGAVLGQAVAGSIF